MEKHKHAHEQLLITKDMPIGEVVELYPEAAEVFTAYGLHCVGCHVSPFETVEQGALGHGMDEHTFEEMLKQANEVAKNPSADGNLDSNDLSSADIVFTEKAVAKVKDIMQKEAKKTPDELYFRLGVMPGGCSGFSYLMQFDDQKAADDVEFKKFGLRVIVDKKSLVKLNGAHIDFVDTLQQSGFKIENPNAKKSCGCGSSFG